MKCSKCGYEYDDQFGFCPMCGQVKESVTEAVNAEEPASEPVQEQAPPSEDSTAEQQAPPQDDTGRQAPPPASVPVATAPPPREDHSAADLRGARNNATAALVCGILGFFIPFIGIVLSIVAIVLGSSAKKRLPESEAGMANAAFILGIISLIFSIIVVIFFISMLGMAFMTAASIMDYGYGEYYPELPNSFWNWQY